MTRILQELTKYDDSLTIKELKLKIEKDLNDDKEKKSLLLENLKKEYNGVYFKRYTDTIFGKTLEIIFINEITYSEYTDQYKLIYHFNGTKITFSSRDIYFKEIDGNSVSDTFNEKELKNLEKITIEQYDDYHNQYTNISNTLKSLL